MKNASEFLLVISPPPSVCHDVSYFKQFIRDAIGHPFDGFSSKAHISLFKYEDPHTESGLYQMEDRVSVFSPFTVSIKNLSVVTDGNYRDICLDIAYKYPIQDLTKELIGREIDPHIVLAKNLEPRDFVVAWRSLKNISYSCDFKCDHITVLKKGTGRWKTHIDLALANSRFSRYN